MLLRFVTKRQHNPDRTCTPKAEIARSAIDLKAMLLRQCLDSLTRRLRDRWIAGQRP